MMKFKSNDLLISSLHENCLPPGCRFAAAALRQPHFVSLEGTEARRGIKSPGLCASVVKKIGRMKSALGYLLLFSAALLVLPGCSTTEVQRFGSVIGLKEESAEKYQELHANTWPEILQNLDETNIHNYSIYLTRMDDGNLYLFSYFEYTGTDLDADFKKLADGPRTKEWWALCDPMQQPLESRADGEWWKNMDEVFHAD